MDLYNINETLPTINSITELIAILRQLFDQNKYIDVNYVQKILLSYKSNVNDWIKFAYFDEQKYTRNLVDKGNGRYNLMLLCWSEGQGSVIHDHSDSHCFMKMLWGSLSETRYDWPDIPENINDSMKVINQTYLKLNDVTYMNDSIGLHRVCNPNKQCKAVSLHLYCPPYSKCQVFDESTGRRDEATVNYYSKYGNCETYFYKQFKQIHEFGIDWQSF
ncbi:cysteine dioxygenase 1-like [Oppia nitens]|uniref:cysteine dioxygenase 1-like n=1 Tax=Oppia nitens TaxID=1686743 RepID=UPI0023DC5468|nr:cysteine dioxygenase 1-like [Oppia nitens]